MGACLLAIAAALTLLALQPPVNADVAWHLALGRVVADGGALYRDIRDPNLPPILWLASGATALADWTGWPAHRWYFLAGALWLAGALAVSRPLLAAAGLGRFPAWLLLAGFAWIFAAVPGLHAGQRDHFAAIALLPYLIAAAVPGRAPGRRLKLAVAGGLAAAVVLKPYYGVAALIVEGWRMAAHGLAWREIRRSEAPLAALLALAVVGLCLALEPAWLDYIARFGGLYALLPPLPLDWQALALIASLPLATLLALAARAALPAALLLGGCGALAVTALQNKWWDYHLLAPGLLAMAGLLAAALSAWPPRRLPAAALLVLALPLLGWGTLSSWRNLSLYHLHRQEPAFQATLAGWIEAAGGPGTRVAVLSGHVVDYMPAIYAAGGRWALPDPSLWQLAAYPRLEPPRPELRDAFAAEIVAGLTADPPALLGLQRTGESGAPAAVFAARDDFQALLRRYRPLGEIRRTRYWRLIEE